MHWDKDGAGDGRNGVLPFNCEGQQACQRFVLTAFGRFSVGFPESSELQDCQDSLAMIKSSLPDIDGFISVSV